VTIPLEIPPEIELPLDRSRMERAFANLIGNALEAMPSGGEVKIRGDAVSVHVEGNGPGITPEIREQFFQPFVTGRPAEM
jgi:signal transduction histidine kinase